MPIGYAITVAVLAVCTAFAIAPHRPQHSSPSSISFRLGFLVNELPFVTFYVTVASTLLAIGDGDVDSPAGWSVVAVAGATIPGLFVVAWRGRLARPATERALRTALGDNWRGSLDAETAAQLPRHLPLVRIVFAPFRVRRRDVERVANIRYAGAGRDNVLDVYRHRSRPAGGPILIHFHGGAFRSGRKNHEARPLLYRLAGQGWICISANYRLSPGVSFPEHLIDAKKVVAWAHEHGREYGADPALVFVAGSSAGGHLASMIALTPNDDFGPIDSPAGTPSSPMDYVNTAAPPFFVAHGDRDSLATVGDARRFVAQLQSVSRNPVVYAELPGGQHVFDLFHSLRFDAVVDAIEGFTAWVRTSDAGTTALKQRSRE